MDKISEYYSNDDNLALRMLMQLDPSGIGGAIDIYLSDLFEKYKKRRAKEFFSQIASENIIITKEMVDSDDFLFAFVSTTNAVLATNKKEKIDLFANLLIYGINTCQYKSEKYEQYLSIIDEITYQELSILEILFELEESVEKRNFVEEDENKDSTILQKANFIWSEFEKKIKEKFDIEPEILKGVLTRINRTGLYETIIGSFWDYTGNRGYTTSLYKEFRKWIIDQPNKEK